MRERHTYRQTDRQRGRGRQRQRQRHTDTETETVTDTERETELWYSLADGGGSGAVRICPGWVGVCTRAVHCNTYKSLN